MREVKLPVLDVGCRPDSAPASQEHLQATLDKVKRFEWVDPGLLMDCTDSQSRLHPSRTLPRPVRRADASRDVRSNQNGYQADPPRYVLNVSL